MPDIGITRYVIKDVIQGPGGWRFRRSRELYPAAAQLYREIFENLGMPLLPGYEELYVSKDEFIAGYDYILGIDVIFSFKSGMRSTLQEKFLFTGYHTVTVEYMQDPVTSEQGDWFTMKAQYYFVGYDRIRALSFQDWILLNWPATQQCTEQNLINWQLKPNRHDGARANFKYAKYENFPIECVVAAQNGYHDFTLPLNDLLTQYCTEAILEANNGKIPSTAAELKTVTQKLRKSAP